MPLQMQPPKPQRPNMAGARPPMGMPPGVGRGMGRGGPARPAPMPQRAPFAPSAEQEESKVTEASKIELEFDDSKLEETKNEIKVEEESKKLEPVPQIEASLDDSTS